ncbi:MAG: hypothetical protein N4A46_07595 [Schleiferiaceae bacterium]|jgi:multisubunit Na+/H+ antiporter MnhB subunit|nr:hypothetical protein [Schleiferiaceae bacterium]
MKAVFTIVFISALMLACTSDKETAQKQIEDYYRQTNTLAGGGQTNISTIKILEMYENGVKAYVTGYYRNSSLPQTEERDLHDTIFFAYYTIDGKQRIKVVKHLKP